MCDSKEGWLVGIAQGTWVNVAWVAGRLSHLSMFEPFVYCFRYQMPIISPGHFLKYCKCRLAYHQAVIWCVYTDFSVNFLYASRELLLRSRALSERENLPKDLTYHPERLIHWHTAKKHSKNLRCLDYIGLSILSPSLNPQLCKLTSYPKNAFVRLHAHKWAKYHWTCKEMIIGLHTFESLAKNYRNQALIFRTELHYSIWDNTCTWSLILPFSISLDIDHREHDYTVAESGGFGCS